MKKTSILFTLLCCFVAATTTVSYAHSHGSKAYGSEGSDKKESIVAIAAGNENFTTLVAAVQAAGLVDVLNGDGPFTVFAPTDAAFAALPEGTVEALLLPENRDQLISILTYHVVPARVLAADVTPGSAPTVNGASLTISTEGSTVRINDATVTQTDIKASNGVIHVVDRVILPAS